MTYLIIFALINGGFITLSRAINGKLSTELNPFKASLWNHLVGFILLSVLIVVMNKNTTLIEVLNIPWIYFLGGFFGVFFVAVSSCVFAKIGALKTSVLIIFGQMLSAIVIEWNKHTLYSNFIQLVGLIIILIGIFLSKKANKS